MTSLLIIHAHILLYLLQPTATKEYKLGLLMPRKHRVVGWEDTAAAATMALTQAKKDGLLNGNTVRLIFADDKCRERESSGNAVDLKWKYDIDGFIAVPCSNAATAVGHLASYWNLPLFSMSATDPALSDKTEFSTLVRMGFPLVRLGAAFKEILSYFKWKQFVMISPRGRNGPTAVLCDYSNAAIENHLRNTDIKLGDWLQFDNDVTDDRIDEMLIRAKQRGRIIILCAGSKDKHNILLRTKNHGMTSGDYVFIVIHNVPPSYITNPWISGTTKENRPLLKSIYKNVIQVSLSSLSGPETEAFLQEIPIKMTEAPWFYNATLDGGRKGSVYALFLYDAMYLYCVALNETLSQRGNPRNGSLMLTNTKNKIFRGVTGDVAIDDNGDKIPNFWLWNMKPDGSEFQVWGEVALTEVHSSKGVNLIKAATWNTADGSIPLDVPKCGFMDELCPPYDLSVVIPTSVAAFLIVAVSVIVLIIFIRRTMHKHELEKMLWRVNQEDLKFIKVHRFGSSVSNMIASVNSLRSSHHTADVSSVTGHGPGQRCALLQGVRVTVAKIKTPTLSLAHSEKVELNVMRQINHENINQFIGMCFDPENICIVTAYCSRGSLQDVLANEEIKLDMVFKKSLLQDLVNGMVYIHNSPLKSHGHLTSDCCLIDNYWVLKVTDFGIQRIRGFKMEFEQPYQINRDLLWTAPEILRQAESAQEPNGTKEGDVYSIGIIMQEIMFRCMPYGKDIDPIDVIEKVKEFKAASFRPDINSFHITDNDSAPNDRDIALMKMCWDEKSQDRPKLTSIKKEISQSQKGRSVIDNMLAIMEKYANNLEEIVDTRTAELVEEKKKTDVLLYSMLPKQVADQLKIGKIVEPEMYEAVTIFFSDIVGFTKLSSESTPIQVIHLLNDLYTLFDDIIKQYDVYKVETIGDAYMIVSGLPNRNGRKHASEIANTALELLKAVTTRFEVRHKPGHHLMLRIGLHTGSCAAGVVGLTMPRYCLFGDTVNTASRMESNGEALKIHISGSCNSILQEIGGYTTTVRGEVEMKGKGKQTTYWLWDPDSKEANINVSLDD